MLEINTKTKDDWTLKNISDFWDYLSSKGDKNAYFTAMVGVGIMNYIKRKITNLQGNCLDYGSGTGPMLKLLLSNKKLNCYGIDYSENSVKEVNTNLTGDNWKGAILLRNFPSNYEANYFDLITFIETIEHLQDNILIETISEINRLLKKGGKVFVTTPFDEKLEEQATFCPFCNSEFHKMQHMQSFNIKSISQLFSNNGFTVDVVENVNFSAFIDIKGYVKYLIGKYILKRKNNNRPHLVLIATKN